MRLPLDTHALIWFYNTDPQISVTALTSTQATGTINLVSGLALGDRNQSRQGKTIAE